jgi:hypothetical protein
MNSDIENQIQLATATVQREQKTPARTTNRGGWLSNGFVGLSFDGTMEGPFLQNQLLDGPLWQRPLSTKWRRPLDCYVTLALQLEKSHMRRLCSSRLMQVLTVADRSLAAARNYCTDRENKNRDRDMEQTDTWQAGNGERQWTP